MARKKVADPRTASDYRKLRPQEELYIACDDLDFSWYPAEIEVVTGLWEQGAPLLVISKAIERDMDDIAVLLISLAREKRITPRPGGVFGRGVNGRNPG